MRGSAERVGCSDGVLIALGVTEGEGETVTVTAGRGSAGAAPPGAWLSSTPAASELSPTAPDTVQAVVAREIDMSFLFQHSPV